jgi:preprotein translocase subunit SecA
MRHFERIVILKVIDDEWRNHLYELDALREGINLRSFAQKDPLIEYKRESFGMFEELLYNIGKNAIRLLYRFRPEAVKAPEEVEGEEVKEQFKSIENVSEQTKGKKLQTPKEKVPALGNTKLDQKFREEVDKLKKEGKRIKDIGRNDKCPCGSGKKFKKCHGKWLK